MTDFEITDPERKKAAASFRQDIKKHVTDISEKYIDKGKTSEGAIMFIPAEAVFAEIHGHFPDLVEFAQHANVLVGLPHHAYGNFNHSKSRLEGFCHSKTYSSHPRSFKSAGPRF